MFLGPTDGEPERRGSDPVDDQPDADQHGEGCVADMRIRDHCDSDRKLDEPDQQAKENMSPADDGTD